MATLLPRYAVLRSRQSPPNDSAMSHNPASKQVQGPIVSEEFQPQATEISKKEVGQSVPPKPKVPFGSSSHIGDCTAQWLGAPCIFRKIEKSISRTFRRASGGCRDRDGRCRPVTPQMAENQPLFLFNRGQSEKSFKTRPKSRLVTC